MNPAPAKLHLLASPAAASLTAGISNSSHQAVLFRPMTPAEDGEESSTSPSEAERQIRSLALGRSSAASQRTAGQRGEDGARSDQDHQAPVSSPLRHPNSEGQFLSRSLPALKSSSPTSLRITAMEAMSTALQSYSADALMAVLVALEDLASESAPLEARKASLLLLQATAGHSGLLAADRARIFAFITASTNSSLVESQIKAIKTLTQDGALLEPMTSSLVAYLHQTLIPQHQAAVEARRRAKALATSNGRRERILEEAGLLALLDYTGTVINNSRDAITGSELQLVTESLIFIAEKTSSPREMKKAASIIHSIITLSSIPEVKLVSCIELLCGITGGIKDLADLTWESLMILARSEDGTKVVPTLLDIIDSRRGGNTYTALGALKFLKFLFCNNGEDKMPALTFDSLMAAIEKACATHDKIQRECLRTIAAVFEDERCAEHLLQENWSQMMTIVLGAIESTADQRSRTGSPDAASLRLSSSSTDLLNPSDATEDTSIKIGDHLKRELRRISIAFVRLWSDMNPDQRHLAAVFFYTLAFKLRLPLEVDSLVLMLKHLADMQLCILGIPPWEVLQGQLVDILLLDRQQDSTVRSRVLELIRQAVPTFGERDEHEALQRSTEGLIESLSDETDSMVIAACAELLSTYLSHLEIDHFSEVIGLCIKTLTTPMTAADESTLPSEAFSTQCASVLVKRLILDVHTSAKRATILYEALIAVAKHDIFPATRMVALKVLIRLRCNQAHSIFIIQLPDTLGLASAVSRNQVSTTSAESSYGRASMYEEHMNPRTGRTSMIGGGGTTMTRASLRSASGPDRSSRSVAVAPLWMYPGSPGLPDQPSPIPSRVLYQHTPTIKEEESLRLSLWLEVVIHELQSASDWEIYSYIVVHLPSQLSNPSLFSHAIPCIKLLRNVLVSQLHNGKFFEPPASSGVKKGDVAYCLYQTLIMLLGYADLFARGEQDDLVRALLAGMTSWDRTNKPCIHGLALSCHIIPGSITRYALQILQKMAQIITQSHLVVDILEFLGGLARLPDIYANFSENDYRTVFAICIRYLELSREKRLQLVGGVDEGANYTSNRSSAVSNASVGSAATLHGASNSPPPSIADTSANVDVHRDLPQYVYAMAYHVLTVWFLSLKLLDRPQHVGWITQNLLWRNESGHEIMEEQSQVVLDMMYRTTYLDLGETEATTHFHASDGKVLRKSWLVGLSIVTVETAARSGLTQLIKRQASGTTYAMYQQSTKPLPAHHVAPTRGTVSSMYGDDAQINILPNHVFLQLSSNIAPTPTPMEAICLPDDEATKRAINFFDQNDTVDGFKIGVIYLAPGQMEESDILANTSGSDAFESFLQGLGTKVELRDAAFNTQGLDRRNDEDGTHTYAWRDRIVEIVYHVPTMMPTNLELDPRCINKKRHMGNDYVNVIFNESGHPFKFDTFPSEYNFINIVITPEALPIDDETAPRNDPDASLSDEPASATSAFSSTPRYTIQTQRQSSLPVISPAATYKLVTLPRLPALTRHLALNAAVFANVWTNRAGGEHISSWRSRLRAIARLREQHANKGASTSAKYPGVRGSKEYKDGDEFAGVVAMGGLAENEGVLGSLDFSRWAGANPPLI